MLLLVQKAASGPVNQERGEGSRPSNSVSIEVLDEQGGRIPDNLNKNNAKDTGDELAPRKRTRVGVVSSQGETSRRGVDVVSGRAVNNTLTIVGHRGIMTPTIDERARKETIEVEIRPHERWIGNTTVPLRSFKIFNLPQDSSAYNERTRKELTDWCLSRTGQVILLCFTLIIFLLNFSLTIWFIIARAVLI